MQSKSERDRELESSSARRSPRKKTRASVDREGRVKMTAHATGYRRKRPQQGAEKRGSGLSSNPDGSSTLHKKWLPASNFFP